MHIFGTRSLLKTEYQSLTECSGEYSPPWPLAWAMPSALYTEG